MNLSKLLLIVLCTSLLFGCKDMTSLQNDPNRTTKATPALLLTGIEQTAFSQISLGAALASRYLVFIIGRRQNQYYDWQRASFGTYGNMRQVLKLEQTAERTGKKQYKALTKFFYSWYIIQLTKTFGDVPYSKALKGKESQFKPPYDRQKDIYVKVLNDLQEANQMLSNNQGPINGDIIYDGNIAKWRKLINSFSLRILISLSHKVGSEDLDVKKRFKEIVTNPQQYPIMTSNLDNAALEFHDRTNNRYPYYNSNDLHTAYFMEESFVNLLQEIKDPRLFIFADPKPNASDLPEKSFKAYGGGLGSAPLGEVTESVLNGEVSAVDKRYYTDPTAEPSIGLSYAETEFNIAEAIQRGWISGNLKMHYQNGIRASMKFYGIPDTVVNEYLTHEGVALESGQKFEQILTQKYLSFFMNSGWMAFYNQRRTGIPTFNVSGGGLGKERIPNRWMYPESELINNTKNVETAIQRQYPNGGDIYDKMWLLKEYN